MSLKFTSTSNYARKQSLTWLGNASPLSFFVRFKFISLDAKQYIFSHVSPTGQISLRRDDTGTKMRFSVTNSNGNFTTKDGTTTLATGTVYTCAGIWKQNDSSGMRLWEGTTERTPATSTTAYNYNTDTGSSTLYLGTQNTTSNSGKCHLDRLLLVKQFELTQAIVEALNDGVHPWQIGPLADKEYSYYPCWGDSLTHIHDYGPSGRHFESGDFVGSVTAGDALGLIDADSPLGHSGRAWRKFAVYSTGTTTASGGTRLTVDRVKNYLGGAHITVANSATVTGGSRVLVSVTSTLTGGALIDFSSPIALTGGARTVVSGSLELTGGGMMLLSASEDVTGGASVRHTARSVSPLTGGGLTSRSRTTTVRGGLRTNTPGSTSFAGGLFLRKSAPGQTLTGGGILKHTRSSALTGGARFTVAHITSLTGGAIVTGAYSRALTGGAKLRRNYTVIATGGASLSHTRTSTLSGGSAVQRGMTRTVQGGGRILFSATTALTGGGQLKTTPAHTVSGGLLTRADAAATVTGGCALTGARGAVVLDLNAEFKTALALTADFKLTLALDAYFTQRLDLIAEF